MSEIQDLRGTLIDGGSRRDIKDIKKIAVHYTYTDEGDAISFQNYWVGHHGWTHGGYHKIILTDGTTQHCYNPEVITNGVKGQNSYTYNISYVSKGAPNSKQKEALMLAVSEAMESFECGISDVLGHREFPNQSTACPPIDMDGFRLQLEGYTEEETKEAVAVVISRPASNVLTQEGDKGDKIRVFQNVLLAAGEKLPRFGADGSFGPETKIAVEAFQHRRGILVDGIIGNQTREEFRKALPRYRRLLRKTSPMTTGNDVRAIQRVIDENDDRIFGQNTKDGVIKYQKARNLTIDGIVGRQTWGDMFRVGGVE